MYRVFKTSNSVLVLNHDTDYVYSQSLFQTLAKATSFK
jgi:hypothetical protein